MYAVSWWHEEVAVLPSLDVFLVGHRVHMAGVDAGWITADVVKLQSVRDWTNEGEVGGSISLISTIDEGIGACSAITQPVSIEVPLPTAKVSDCYSIEEILF